MPAHVVSAQTASAFCAHLARSVGELNSGGGPSTYGYCVVCYRVIVAPHVRSVGHVFAYLYTLDYNSKRSMDYETSLLPKVFPLRESERMMHAVHFHDAVCAKYFLND